jgi:hypothetical protein
MPYRIYCPPSHLNPSLYLLSYALSSTLTVDRAILGDAREWGWRIDPIPLPCSKSISATVEYLDSRYRHCSYTHSGASLASEQGGYNDREGRNGGDVALLLRPAVCVSNPTPSRDKDDTSKDSRKWTRAKWQVWRIWQAEHGRRVLEAWREKRLEKGVEGVGWRERVWRLGRRV